MSGSFARANSCCLLQNAPGTNAESLRGASAWGTLCSGLRSASTRRTGNSSGRRCTSSITTVPRSGASDVIGSESRCKLVGSSRSNSGLRTKARLPRGDGQRASADLVSDVGLPEAACVFLTTCRTTHPRDTSLDCFADAKPAMVATSAREPIAHREPALRRSMRVASIFMFVDSLHPRAEQRGGWPRAFRL